MIAINKTQKVVLVIGTSQGIGTAAVRAYRSLGYRIIATARSVKPTSDSDILVVPGDISDGLTVARAISEGPSRFGHIDTLISNAGAAFGQDSGVDDHFRC
jgi:NAD(P)-dependent dehydrogenase (short-subunit alcohol dehydrogenase family)